MDGRGGGRGGGGRREKLEIGKAGDVAGILKVVGGMEAEVRVRWTKQWRWMNLNIYEIGKQRTSARTGAGGTL